MVSLAVLFTVFIGFGLLWLGRAYFRHRRRERLRLQPIPPHWKEILEEEVPIYRYLNSELREQLHGLIQIFIAEKPFEGCGGLEVTEEMKVIIAAQACVLLLNRKVKMYPKLDAILVYPTAFVAKTVEQHGWGGFVEKEQVRLGESWHQGMLVLAWDNVQRGAHDPRDGHNVVLHEFAHQLDQEDGRSNGAPLLEKGSHYAGWARHLGEAYKELQAKVAEHQPSLIDPYGATNPAEFFAVLTETFFEKARALKKKYPKLYQELKTYYNLDPATWNEES
ncbi:MAG: zinc-dependent peptidase [bacterium]|nr:zinc-dependent peptidase [bacterium]